MLTGNGHAITQASKMGQQMAKNIWENRHYLVIGWILLALIMAPFAWELAAWLGELHMLHVCVSHQKHKAKQQTPIPWKTLHQSGPSMVFSN